MENFSLNFRTFDKGLRERDMEVVKNFNLTVEKGEVVAVLGESGSGKSLLANAILGLLPVNAEVSGTLLFKGQPLTPETHSILRGKEISLIPQTVNALDPLMKTGKQVQGGIIGNNKKDIQHAIFEKVGLSRKTGDYYPFELSGGMARRVLVSTAMISDASLIIADEPTPGLDSQVLQETIRYMRELANNGKGIMFITHDVEVALEIADKIAVFHEGETVEIADAEDFSGKGENLSHPYTKVLWNALPKNEFALPVTSDERKENLKVTPDRGPLHIEGISYHYSGEPWLFKDMNLKISPGEIVGIYGPSGSGKSTMAQIISGYMKAAEGKVRIGGEELSKDGRYPIQMVWQHPEKSLNPRWRMKKSLQEAGKPDADLLNSLGIRNEWMNRWPSELSGGELQRFCLARALMKDADYLVADEITTMLDAVNQAQIWHSLIKLSKERNLGILAISHDYQLLERVCNRIINFDDLTLK